jgi:hypothetical protein
MFEADASSPAPLDAMRLRVLLGRADLSEEAAATVLEVDQADMRAYVEGKKPAPRYVILALERIVDMRGMSAERSPVTASA